MTNDLSPTMNHAVVLAMRNNGKITRFPGGFWIASDKWSQPQFGTPTIQALVSRGVMKYTQWQEGKSRFPIEATVIQP